MIFKDWLRSKTPNFILSWNRKRKKKTRNKILKAQASSGESLTSGQLILELKGIGLLEGDTLLVHSSLGKIGHLVDGPKTFVDALLNVIGEKGNLLMPTSPNSSYQLDYIQNCKLFDVNFSQSKTGAITEYFRQLSNSKRSLHPTEPVSVVGPKADSFIDGHFNALTPYQSDSPFGKVAAENGKILYVGVTLDNAGTSLHTLEDAIPNFKFPVYHPDIFEINVKDVNGILHSVKTKVHNPKFSLLRQCDKLIPHFKEAGVLKEVKIGKANSLLVDAKGFFDTMVKLYYEKGITMYTPNGDDLKID